jgi:hypothetical protein
MSSEVMEISSFSMCEVSEDSILDHIEYEEFLIIVATVLYHNAMLSCLFCHLQQSIAIREVIGDGNFGGNMFALFHSIEAHGSMKMPRSADQYQVQIISFTELLPVMLVFAVDSGRVGLILFESFDGLFAFGRIKIGHGHYLCGTMLYHPVHHFSETLTSIT